MMANQAEIRLVLNHSPAAVFEALTDTEMVMGWFAESAEIDLAQGRYDYWGRFTPETPDREAGCHPILAVTLNEAIRYQWQTEQGPSEVGVALKAYQGGTLLALTHEIFPKEETEAGEESGVFPLEDFWFLSLENLRRFLDGRSVTRCDFSIKITGDVVVSFDFDAPADEVFGALIRPDQLNQWIANQAVVEPKIGGNFDYGWGASGPDKVTEFESGRKLAYVSEGYEDIFPELVTTWTLEGSGGRTRLTLVQSGFVTDLYQDGLHIGWHFFISWLRSLVEYDTPWQPPIKRLAVGTENQYPASVAAGQYLFEM
ncbi:MAG: SRPBCC domain-containing protein [Candidatus Promineifilaceae bacterium]